MKRCQAISAGIFSVVILSLLLPPAARAGLPITNAYDNADLPIYTGAGGGWTGLNGGFGYNTWTALGGAGGGGGTYMENSGSQVDGADSFGIFAGSGSYAISRPLSSSMTFGEFDIATRFNLAGNGNNLFSLRSGNNTSGFGSGELLSFGIASGSQLDYTDGSGFHLLSSGEARGPAWQWNVDFDAGAGTYTLSVTNLGGGYATTVTGNLESSGTTVGSFAAINSSAGANQNLIFDSPTFTVPEPSTFALAGLAAGALALLRRRKF